MEGAGRGSIWSWHQTPAVPHPSYVLAISSDAGAASGLCDILTIFWMRVLERVPCHLQWCFKALPLMTFVFPGLTWQDDGTQQAISRELAKLRSTPLHRQATPPGPRAAYGDSRDRKLRPGQAELNRNLQQYLSSLGFLQLPDMGGQLGVQPQEAIVQVKVSDVRAF